MCQESQPYSRHHPLDPSYFFEDGAIALESDIAKKLCDAQRRNVEEILAIFNNPNDERPRKLTRTKDVAGKCKEMSLDMRRNMALMFIASRKELQRALLPKGEDSSGGRLASVSQETVEAFLQLVQNRRNGKATQNSIADDKTFTDFFDAKWIKDSMPMPLPSEVARCMQTQGVQINEDMGCGYFGDGHHSQELKVDNDDFTLIISEFSRDRMPGSRAEKYSECEITVRVFQNNRTVFEKIIRWPQIIETINEASKQWQNTTSS